MIKGIVGLTTHEYSIGDLIVVPEGTINPYTKGAGIIGDVRKRQLFGYLMGRETPGYDIWYAPSNGGARKLKLGEACASKDVLRHLMAHLGLEGVDDRDSNGV